MGLVRNFLPKGKLVGEWVYRDGRLEGTSKTYYENEQPKNGIEFYSWESGKV